MYVPSSKDVDHPMSASHLSAITREGGSDFKDENAALASWNFHSRYAASADS